MSHPTTPTLWDASICADCGFPVAQHETLYGAQDHEIQRSE